MKKTIATEVEVNVDDTVTIPKSLWSAVRALGAAGAKWVWLEKGRCLNDSGECNEVCCEHTNCLLVLDANGKPSVEIHNDDL